MRNGLSRPNPAPVENAASSSRWLYFRRRFLGETNFRDVAAVVAGAALGAVACFAAVALAVLGF
jgi:hypothetical protein